MKRVQKIAGNFYSVLKAISHLYSSKTKRSFKSGNGEAPVMVQVKMSSSYIHRV